MNEEEARAFDAPFRFLESELKPKRLELDSGKYGRIVKGWWKYFHSRLTMYDRIRADGLQRVLLRTRNSDHHNLFFVETDVVFLDTVIVFLFGDNFHFGVLQSDLHEVWARAYASSLGSGLRYGVGNCFETFPFPPASRPVEECGSDYYLLRSNVMVDRDIGAVDVSNLVADPDCTSSDIMALRARHVDLNRAVCDAYGWSDLELDHGHWETPQGIRFTVSPEAKDELLDRLLELNHQRYAEEVAAGLHDKKSKKAPAKRAKAVDKNQESML